MLEIILNIGSVPTEAVDDLKALSHSSDFVTLISELCETLDKYDFVDFRVSGFGEAQWPVSIYPDMATLIECIPDALEAIEKAQDFEIDFYEQGIERRIEFCISGTKYIAKCHSWTDWTPSPRIHEISRAELFQMLEAVQCEITSLLNSVLPSNSASIAMSKLSRKFQLIE